MFTTTGPESTDFAAAVKSKRQREDDHDSGIGKAEIDGLKVS